MDLSGVLDIRGIDHRDLISVKKSKLDWPELDEVVEFSVDKFQEITRVGVQYDVDVDGLGAGKITEDNIRKFGLMVYRFMNTRKKHGINDDVIDWVKLNNIELLYVVDAGTNDIEYHKILSSMGVYVIVLDHHIQSVKESVENVFIVNCSVHAHLPELSGAGVCYRYVEALDRAIGGLGVSHYEPWVGLTVLSDQCSLLDQENRYYVEKLYSEYENIDLFKSFTFWGSKRNLFQFGVIPFLNACIRTNNVDWAMDAVSMSGVSKLKKFISEKRSDAIDLQKRMLLEMRDSSQKLTGKQIIIIRLSDTHLEWSGLTGLLANQLVNETKKSIIVLYEDVDGVFRGSFRGIGGMTDKSLESVGWTVRGHPQAAGVELSKDSAGSVIKLTRELVVGEADPEFDFELEDRDIVRNLEHLTSMARFNELTSGELKSIQFKLNPTRVPFKNVWGKKVEYNFQSFRVRDFVLDRRSNESWIIEPLLDKEGIVLLRK